MPAATKTSPLSIADQGFFWVGVERSPQSYGTIPTGQMYVQYQIPAAQTHPYPIVMVHGGGGQGTDYLGTPDGRPGWATWFLRQGYAVYVVDRPGHGRSPFHPDALGAMRPPATFEAMRALFTAPESNPEAYPQARLHHQWPRGSEAEEAGYLEQLLAGMGPMQSDLPAVHRNMQRLGAALLDRIGPAILMTHSAGGPFGWMVAEARPKLVKAIVAVEPFSPPFTDGPFGSLVWGLTAAPVTYDPPAAEPAELKRELRKAPRADLQDTYVQAEPARRLPNLRSIPILVVVSEAAWMATFTHGVVDFLKQAGAPAELLRLEEAGIHGNGHMMMSEKNSDEIAALLNGWIERTAKKISGGQNGERNSGL
jgi:pimeloyl-ACP methyl ester carboxylesterase